MMMAVVVVATEPLLFPPPPPPPVDVPEECVDAAVIVLALVLATESWFCWEPAAAPLDSPVRSSFMARLASSVSVREVGEVVVELGWDFSCGIAAVAGISRSMDFWLTALCVSVERLSQICLVGSISIIETMVCRHTRGKVTSPGLAGNDETTYGDDDR